MPRPVEVPTENVYVFRCKAYKSVGNTGGLIGFWLTFCGQYAYIDFAYLTSGVWLNVERVLPATAVYNPFPALVDIQVSYVQPITGNYVLISDMSVENKVPPQVTWQKTKTATYVVSAEDMGRQIASTSFVMVIDALSTQVPVGAWFEVYNNSASSISIQPVGATTLRLAGTATTGTRTLAGRGIATVTKVAAYEWVVGGNGVT